MKERKPVVLKLEGGLGNQLFQLAAGYYLAAKLDSDLYLDQYSIPLTTAHGETRSGFEPFEPLRLPNSRSVQLLSALPSRFTVRLANQNTFVKRVVIKARLIRSNCHKLKLFIESNELKSTADFLATDTPMKLHGNFQSWEIVEKAAQYGFPRVFRLRDKPQWIIELERTIDFKNSVVLHFRVGDDTRTNYNFRQPEIGYYFEALKILKRKRKFDNVHILSDDISRVKEMYGDRFKLDFHYLEMPSNSSAGERLYVLSLFGGIVCANSTFCGWAAWSIYNSGGEVVIPVPYSDGPVLGSRDFPLNWHQLDKTLGTIVA